MRPAVESPGLLDDHLPLHMPLAALDPHLEPQILTPKRRLHFEVVRLANGNRLSRRQGPLRSGGKTHHLS